MYLRIYYNRLFLLLSRNFFYTFNNIFSFRKITYRIYFIQKSYKYFLI